MTATQNDMTDATKPVPFWYVLDSGGVATLCADEDDARRSAAEFDEQRPLRSPHRAVRLVESTNPPAEGAA